MVSTVYSQDPHASFLFPVALILSINQWTACPWNSLFIGTNHKLSNTIENGGWKGSLKDLYLARKTRLFIRFHFRWNTRALNHSPFVTHSRFHYCLTEGGKAFASLLVHPIMLEHKTRSSWKPPFHSIKYLPWKATRNHESTASGKITMKKKGVTWQDSDSISHFKTTLQSNKIEIVARIKQ